MGNYDPQLRHSIDRQNEILATQNKLLASLVTELRLGNDLTALELGVGENTAMIALAATVVEQARGKSQ